MTLAFDGAADASWQPALFHSPTVALKHGDGLVIRTRLPPAGVSFRRDDLEANENYSLTVSGEGKGVSIRWVGDDKNYHYGAAPDGVQELTISGTSSVEILVYADRPFTYHLRGLKLKKCLECLSDAGLRAHLFTELPELRGLLETDRLGASAQLLDWAANVADTGNDHSAVWENTSSVSGMSAGDIYSRVLVPNKGGYWCAGKAVFLEKVLRIFEFDAFTVNFGIEPDGLNHVAVIVVDAGSSKDSSDGWRFFLLDPTFNATFEENGQMITVNELLRRSQLGLINESVVNQRALSHLEYIVPRETAKGNRCETKLGDLGADVLCRNKDITLNGYFTDPMFWGSLLKRNGFELGAAGYFDLFRAGIFGVGGDPKSKARSTFIDGVRQMGIRVGGPDA